MERDDNASDWLCHGFDSHADRDHTQNFCEETFYFHLEDESTSSVIETCSLYVYFFINKTQSVNILDYLSLVIRVMKKMY